jgi:putative ABC transport system ATP-binding protein
MARRATTTAESRQRAITEHSILTTDKLCKTFSTGGVQQHVLKNLDLSIGRGDFTVIMGASGAGKSTLLSAPFCRSHAPVVSTNTERRGTTYGHL